MHFQSVRSLMAVSVLCFMLGHSAVRRHRPRVSRMQQTIRDLSGQTRQDKTSFGSDRGPQIL